MNNTDDEPEYAPVPYMPTFTSDYRSDMLGVPPDAQGFYGQLRCLIWEAQGPIRNDPVEIARQLQWDPRVVKRLIAALCNSPRKLLVSTPEQLMILRMTKELERSARRAEHRRYQRSDEKVTAKMKADLDQKYGAKKSESRAITSGVLLPLTRTGTSARLPNPDLISSIYDLTNRDAFEARRGKSAQQLKEELGGQEPANALAGASP